MHGRARELLDEHHLDEVNRVLRGLSQELGRPEGTEVAIGENGAKTPLRESAHASCVRSRACRSCTGSPEATRALTWRRNRLRGSSTRRPHPLHRMPISAPSLTTSHWTDPHGWALRIRTTSPRWISVYTARHITRRIRGRRPWVNLGRPGFPLRTPPASRSPLAPAPPVRRASTVPPARSPSRRRS